MFHIAHISCVLGGIKGSWIPTAASNGFIHLRRFLWRESLLPMRQTMRMVRPSKKSSLSPHFLSDAMLCRLLSLWFADLRSYVAT